MLMLVVLAVVFRDPKRDREIAIALVVKVVDGDVVAVAVKLRTGRGDYNVASKCVYRAVFAGAVLCALRTVALQQREVQLEVASEHHL
jgi:hypothetical protein